MYRLSDKLCAHAHPCRLLRVRLLALLIALLCLTTRTEAQILTPVQAVFDSALSALRSVVVSPDGNHTYAVGDDTLWAFERGGDGALTQIQKLQNQIDDADGLLGAFSVSLSPDGRHVYVASADDNAVAVFERDETSGALAFVEVHFDDIAGVDGLDRASGVSVSPLGDRVYVVSRDDDALAVFSRNEATGALTFIEAHFDGVAGVDGLSDAYAVTVSPDGAHIYVAASRDNSLAVFASDEATGALSFIEAHFDDIAGVDGLEGATSVAISPDGARVYVAAPGDDAVAVFSRDEATGALTFVEAQIEGVGAVEGLVSPYSVTVSPDGAQVYVASFSDAAVVVFATDESTGALTFVEALFDGVGDIDGLSGAISITVSPDGANIYVASFFGDAVVVFARDPVTGALSFTQTRRGDVIGLRGAYSVAVSPDGTSVYATSLLDESLVVFSRDPVSGVLNFVDALFNDVDITDFGFPTSAAVSPDAKNVYAANFIDDPVLYGTLIGGGSLLAFTRDAKTGTLTFLEAQLEGDGDVNGLTGANSVTLSPDGAHLYVASVFDNAVVVFSRDAATGALTFVEAQIDIVGSVSGFSFGAVWLAVSPDGRHVYVAYASQRAVAVFERDEATGALTFGEAYFDGAAGGNGLRSPTSLTVSPDGAHVYVVAAPDDAVTVFTRDATSGRLTLVETLFGGVDGVEGLSGASCVTTSPSGDRVYVASTDDSSVSVFERNSATGALTFVEAHFDEANGVHALGGAASVAISPDGAHLYIGSTDDDALQVFAVAPNVMGCGAGTGASTSTLSRNGFGPDPGAVLIVTALCLLLYTRKSKNAGYNLGRKHTPRHTVHPWILGLLLSVLAPITSINAQILTSIQTLFDTSLVNIESLAVSPQGNHLYAVGTNILWVFERGNDGALMPIEAHRDGVKGVEGLVRAISVDVSPDGAYVYVVGRDDDSIVVFSRNKTTGALVFIEALFDGIGDIEGLNGPVKVKVSPDSAHVYVASSWNTIGDDAIAVFSRDEATGTLTMVDVERPGVDGVIFMSGPESLTISQDGAHVYVAASSSSAVTLFTRNETTGALTFVETYRDGVDDVDGLRGANSIAVSQDGSNVYVTGPSDEALAGFARNEKTGALTFVEALFDGVEGVQGLVKTTSLSLSPDGKHVYVVGDISSYSAPDTVAVFARNLPGGTLSHVQTLFNGTDGIEGLGGPRSVTVSPDGEDVYIGSFNFDAIVFFERDAASGELNFIEAQLDGSGGANGLDRVSAVTVSPDGAHVYVVSKGGGFDGAVVAFARDATTGALTFIEAQFNRTGDVEGLPSPLSIVVSPNGAHLYVTAATTTTGDGSLVFFRRDVMTGALTFVEAQYDGVAGISGLEEPYSITLSPDGAHVYVAGFTSNAVALFARDAVTGTLSFVEAQFDGVGGVDGLRSATSVAVSPDGKHVYVSGASDDAIAAFARDDATGALTFLGAQFDGQGGVNRMRGPVSIALSADGANLYVAAFLDNSVAVFTRDPATGALTFEEAQFDGARDVIGLDLPMSVGVSPDGAHVYVAAQGANSIVVFARDAATGRLTFQQANFDETSEIHPGFGPNALAVSPDSANVYVVSFMKDAVQVFDVAGEGLGCSAGNGASPSQSPGNGSGTLLTFTALCLVLRTRRTNPKRSRVSSSTAR